MSETSVGFSLGIILQNCVISFFAGPMCWCLDLRNSFHDASSNATLGKEGQERPEEKEKGKGEEVKRQEEEEVRIVWFVVIVVIEG